MKPSDNLMIYIVIMLSVLMIAFGCATPRYNYVPRKMEISKPPIGSVNTAYICDSMLQQGNYIEHDAIYFPHDDYFPHDVRIYVPYIVMRGYYYKIGEDEETEFYLPSGGADSGHIVKAESVDQWQVLQVYKNKQKACVVTVFNFQACGNDVIFERKEISSLQENSLQQTLIYYGRLGNKVTIGYREFSNKTDRPVFNNNLEYDLKDSDIIEYKGARLRILEATNEYIQYKVIANFNRGHL